MRKQKLHSNKTSLAVFCALAIATTTTICWPGNVLSKSTDSALIPQTPRHVDIAIALDVSGSMSGLINSAKQRLWDIINELTLMQPTPQLRVAILTYGNPAYGAETGYVQLDINLIDNLDAVNEKLFSFRTSGGDEYVGRVVSKAVNQLNWSKDESALKLIFVAGNESAFQDPVVSWRTAAKEAASKGIQVNTIYCGDQNNSDALGWSQVAALADGTYASINQNEAAVASISSPMDARLIRLNEELNKTYIPYGQRGLSHQANQVAQDANAASMSPQAAASRVVTKSSSYYRNAFWDVVDAVKGGKKVNDIAEKDLPENMQKMNEKERIEHVEAMANKRSKLKNEISQLDQERRTYISKEQSKRNGSKSAGLDMALKASIRKQAVKKGFSFKSN